MPELVERGHIFIAQPPLYKVKHGKQERYLKDDHELKQHLLRMALEDAELHTGVATEPLRGEALEQVAKEYLLAEAVIDRVGRHVDPLVLHALFHHPSIRLDDPGLAAEAAASLAALVGSADLTIEARYDEKTESNLLVIRRMQHGNVRTTHLERDFLQSGDYEQLARTGALLKGLIGDGAYARRGQHTRPVETFGQALDWLLDEARRGLSIQRYKGLGEMNPDQLWETTMDPGTRILLRTQIEDMIAADEIFSKLMGDLVEPRREFIEANALGVRNLDV
jgi:DNA gyrase subunit B